MTEPVQAVIALGSNLGDREQNVRAALDAIAAFPETRVLRESALMENPAVNSPPGAGDFLNGAVLIETALKPHDLLARLLETERALGRERTERNAPRAIDLDILLYGEQVIDTPELKVPHPRIAEREFVLWPLLQILPKATNPITSQPYANDYARLRTES
jgi:2-amino-4-hydroxy-6-hydroxymethyldihydropteridine diphosphokinase